MPRSYRPTPPSRKQHTAWPGGRAYDVSTIPAVEGAALLDGVALLVDECDVCRIAGEEKKKRKVYIYIYVCLL